MNKKTLFPVAVVAVAGVFALEGCQNMTLSGTSALATTCDQTNCHITVYVTPAGGLRVDKDPLAITKRNINVQWDIDQDTSGDYKFADTEGIRFASDPSGQFNCNVTGNGKKFLCAAKNTVPGDYKYSIKLIGPNTITLDPTIKNQG